MKNVMPTRHLLQRILPALEESHLPLHAVHLAFRSILPYGTELASDDLEPDFSLGCLREILGKVLNEDNETDQSQNPPSR